MCVVIIMMTVTDDKLARAVRRAIRRSPLSVRQLALEAGVDPSLLARLLSGEKRVSPESAARLERALVAIGERCAESAAIIRKANTQRRRH
jgi:transcriptional regulator with XRE-family HTH domain